MDVNDVLRKYSGQIESQIGSYNQLNEVGDVSRDYITFKSDMMPELSRYESWVKSLGGIVKIKLALKDDIKIRKYLQTAHLNVEPGEVVGLAVISFILLTFLGILASVGIWFISGGPGLSGFPFLFLFMILITASFIFYYFYSTPSRLATKWRLKASSQMVPAVLYTVIYMKHTSNLERAINFVGQHIEAPLSLDFRRILWDVETGRYSTVKDSLEAYLEFWKESNIEFVESFHLIESSLFEPSETRRVEILERALKVILDGVYERMLAYTREIRSPLTNLYMLGIVLPTLGLALLPLVSTLLNGLVKWYHVFLLFNIIIPFFVFYMTVQIMLKRPGGYGETSLLEKNPLYWKYKSKQPYFKAALICVPLLLIGLLPLIFGYTSLPSWIGLQSDYNLKDLGLGIFGNGKFFDFQTLETGMVGPFGFGALILSLFVPFSIALFFSMSFSMKTKELIKSRDNTKGLEDEFVSSLFTLGNRLGDGVPAEIAFAKVVDSTRGQRTADFFRIVNSNIQSMGMGLEDAIFNSHRGAIIYYPSNLIATSMMILVESVKKGLKVAAQSLMSISEYIQNIKKINERLRDLLAEVVSDMSSNMTFLAPLLAGIVIGLAAMITGILGQLKTLLAVSSQNTGLVGLGNLGNIIQLFDITNMVPPYYLQISIGLYIIEIAFILTSTLVTIDSGEDKLKSTREISKNLMKGGLLYLITALISIVALSILAGVALGALAT